jgi:hypothetical protein
VEEGKFGVDIDFLSPLPFISRLARRLRGQKGKSKEPSRGAGLVGQASRLSEKRALPGGRARWNQYLEMASIWAAVRVLRKPMPPTLLLMAL